MQENHAAPETGHKRLTPNEFGEVIASRPDMRGPKADIDAVAWSLVDKIMKQRNMQTDLAESLIEGPTEGR